MEFKVPQFLEIEDKIFGPFTFKEFVYLAGGAGLCFVLYRLLGLFLGIIPIVAVAGFSVALTFYRPNNKPFINMVGASLNYFTQSKLYIWQKRKLAAKPKMVADNLTPDLTLKNGAKLSGSKLRDLAWSLDVLDLKKTNKT